MELNFDGQTFKYNWWDGELLKGTDSLPFAFDTETALIKEIESGITDPRDIPTVSLGMAFDGQNLVLIHPDQLKAFVNKHKFSHWVGHNFSFDFWVLFRHLDLVGREELWQIGDRSGYHCTMVLDQLLQLASGNYRIMGKGGEQKLWQTNLGVLAEEWKVGEVDKTDVYRLRFGELIGLSQEEMQSHPEAEQFFSYALKDVIATYRVFAKQYQVGLEWMQKAGWVPHRVERYEIRSDALSRFGVLSEKLQTKASIVLAELSRTPIRIDRVKRDELEANTRLIHREALEYLISIEPELVQKTKDKYKKIDGVRTLIKEAEVKFTDKTGVPRFNNGKLIEILCEEADRIGVTPPISSGKLGRISTSFKEWKHLASQSEFIKNWGVLEEEAKFLEFLTSIDADEVYSHYNLLMVTGRTSANAYRKGGKVYLPSLNIQQLPRSMEEEGSNIRDMFLPPKGYKWGTIDYSYIEIRTMASVALARYGKSDMAEVTIKNTLHGEPDPHIVTAASIEGMEVKDFLRLPKDVIKEKRQTAKLGNFGLLSGMGVETFVIYAKNAGCSITPQRAKEVKKGWKKRYSEMNEYLKDSTNVGLGWECKKKWNPNLPDNICWRLTEFLKQGMNSKSKKKSKKFTEKETEYFWSILEIAANLKGNEKTQEDIENRRITQRVRQLSYYRACTLTGRIRNKCSYTEERNASFQSLCSDACKNALWNLMRRGFKILNFVHDEIGVALPEKTAKIQLAQVMKIMEKSAEEIIGNNVPIKTEGCVDAYWKKS